MIGEMFRFQALQDRIHTDIGFIRSTTMTILLDERITLTDKRYLLKKLHTDLMEELNYVNKTITRVSDYYQRYDTDEDLTWVKDSIRKKVEE